MTRAQQSILVDLLSPRSCLVCGKGNCLMVNDKPPRVVVQRDVDVLAGMGLVASLPEKENELCLTFAGVEEALELRNGRGD